MTFDSTAVKAEMTPLLMASPLAATSANDSFNDSFNKESNKKNYFAHYGIDLESQLEGVSHALGFIDSQGYRIACHVFLSPSAKGTAFLLHGYYDHVGLFQHILRFMLEQGYNVLAFDLPGHGLSSGNPANIKDFRHYSLILEDILSHCQGKLPSPWHAYGHSTGCAILTDYFINLSYQNMEVPFDQVIYSAPLVRPWSWWTSRIQLYLLRPFIKQLPRRFTDNCRDIAFLEFIRSDPLAPAVLPTQWVSALDRWIRMVESTPMTLPSSPLIVQGTYDRTVDARHNIAILKRLFTNPEVLYLEDARHHLPNELEATRKEYMAWLASFI